MVMKYRMISGCVTVKGPPFLICSRNNGITDPFDPSTLPKRVVMNCVLFCPVFSRCLDSDWTYISQILFEQPITLEGFTALSVETITNFCAPYFTARSARIFVPRILVWTDSETLSSIMGTCL